MCENIAILALLLTTSVATFGVAALLLRHVVRDTLELTAALPARVPKDDTAEGRVAHRRTLFRETIALLILRSVPGALLIVCGIGLVVWASYNVTFDACIRCAMPFTPKYFLDL